MSAAWRRNVYLYRERVGPSVSTITEIRTAHRAWPHRTRIVEASSTETDVAWSGARRQRNCSLPSVPGITDSAAVLMVSPSPSTQRRRNSALASGSLHVAEALRRYGLPADTGICWAMELSSLIETRPACSFTLPTVVHGLSSFLTFEPRVGEQVAGFLLSPGQTAAGRISNR